VERTNRTTAAVVAGLVLGTLVLALCALAARDGRLSWDAAQLAALAPVVLALVFGLAADLRGR